MARGEIFWLSDHTGGNVRRSPLARDAGLRGAVFVPVRRSIATTDVLEVFSSRVEAPDQVLLDTLDAISREVGQFIDRRDAQQTRSDLERQRRHLLDLLELQLEHMPVACVLQDDQFRVVYCNPTAERIFGYRLDELRGQDITGLIVPDAMHQAVAVRRERLRCGERGVRATVENRRKDGTPVICEWYFMPFYDEAEAVLGAFVVGIVFGQIRGIPDGVHERIESVAFGIFTPVFFAVAGLKVNLLHLLRMDLVLLTLVVMVTVTLAKGVGTYVGARVVGGRNHWNGHAFAASLNTRGAMDIIIATIGLSLGVLSQDMFSIIVLMAITTALVMPAVLRKVLANVEPSDDEVARLEREELAAESFVAYIHRVLLPIRLHDATHVTYSIEASVLEKLESTSPIALTLLTIKRPGERAKGIDFLVP